MTLRYPEDTAAKLLARLATQRRNFTGGQDSGTESAAQADFQEHFNSVMPLPSLHHLRELLDVSFFASLMTEEGERVSFTIAYISPELGRDSRWSMLRFRSPLRLAPGVIRRLSPALVPDNIYCAVFPNAEGTLELWGLIFLPRSIGFDESLDLPGITICSYQPGVILVRQSTHDVMIDSRGNATFVDEGGAAEQTGLRMLLAKMVGNEQFRDNLRAATELLRLARVALHAGHGATFLLLPMDQEPEALSEPNILADEQSRNLIAEALKNPTFESLPDLLARLAFVDGAMVLDGDLNFLGAGAMIRPPLGSAPTEIQYVLINPSKPTDYLAPKSIDEFPGGSRHRSAIQFCYWNPGSVAVVVSNDGVMTLMSRLTREDSVLVLRPFYPSGAGL